MELLNMPPEMFQHVIYYFVNDVGIAAALEARKVCKLFYKCIKHEVFSKQPIEAFLSTEMSGQNFLSNNMGVYLTYRVKSVEGAREFLPRFIIATVDDIILAAGPETETKRREYSRILCELLATHCPCTYHFITTHETKSTLSKSIFAKECTTNQVAAAAAVGSVPALQVFLSQKEELAWEKSLVFGYPLAAATLHCQLPVIHFLLAHLESHVQAKHTLKPLHLKNIEIAIAMSLNGHSKQTTEALFHCLEKFFPIPTQQTYERWMFNTIRSHNKLQLLTLLRLEHEGGVQSYFAGFKEACRFGYPEIARLFIDNGFLRLEQGTRSHELLNPLSMAASYGHVCVVEEILDMGAHPDGPVYAPDRLCAERPLWIAVNHVYTDVVKLLLDRGADAGLVWGEWEYAGTEFRRYRGEIGRLLEDARQKKEEEEEGVGV